VRKPPKFDQEKGVRRLARERVGAVPSGKVIQPKTRRKKPKHKKPPGNEDA
jgi:hypothetical protein